MEGVELAKGDNSHGLCAGRLPAVGLQVWGGGRLVQAGQQRREVLEDEARGGRRRQGCEERHRQARRELSSSALTPFKALDGVVARTLGCRV